MDSKDYAILRELDVNFRENFSKIGKKVGLSKNSVALRFDKLRECMLHNTTGINNELIGYTLVKIYYSFDYYNDETEKDIIEEVKKNKNILWVARFYGSYDVCMCLLVKNLENLVSDVTNFDEKFSNKINKKELQIIYQQHFFRNNFIHLQPVMQKHKIIKPNKKIELSDSDKKIISLIKNDPRISIVDISRKTKLTPKTVSTRIKTLENKGVIMGYFMTLDPTKFNFNTFKILIQIQNLQEPIEFENYLKSIKTVKYITKMLGLWDYEVDFIYPNITELQKQIDLIKEKFPGIIKKMEIVSFGKRIITNKDNFLA